MPLDPSSLFPQLQSLIAEAIDIPPDDVHPELAFGDLPQWDSLGHMEIMLRLEDQFGIEMDAELIGELTSVPSITRYLANRNGTE